MFTIRPDDADTVTADPFAAAILAGMVRYAITDGESTMNSVDDLHAMMDEVAERPMIDAETVKVETETFWQVHLADGSKTVVMAVSKGAAYKAAVSLYPAGKAPLSEKITCLGTVALDTVKPVLSF